MSYVKPTYIQKLRLFLTAAALFLFLAVSALPFTATAGTPAPAAGSQAAQCQGTDTACVCPSDNPDCGDDPVFKNCKQDKNTQAYTNCRANNDLFKTYVNPFIAFLSFAVGLAVVIGVIIGGMQYITSAGDPQKAATGKRHIWNAIIAMLVYLFLFALLNFLIPGGVV